VSALSIDKVRAKFKPRNDTQSAKFYEHGKSI